MVSGKVHRKILVTAVASATMLGACASSSPSGDGEDPIKIGAVSSITGPAPFPEVPAAAGAVFDSVNAEGGIDGRMIEFISRDDGGDPGKANQQARSLADEHDVVAFVGGASLVDCNANGGLYEDKDVISLMGAGVEPECFTSTHIAPVNNGTVQGYANLLYFASEHLDHTRVCPIILKSPGLTEPYLELIEQWETDTGSTAALVDTSINLGDDPTPVMLAIEKAECDAVVFNSNEPTAVAFMDAAKRQGVLESADWLTLAAAYTDSVLDTLASQDTLGLYVNSEFVPLNDDSPALETWRDTLEDADVQRTSLSMGGYVAAQVVVDVLNSIEGEITREALTEAIANLDSLDHPLVGNDLSFAQWPDSPLNRSSRMLQATQDGWEPVGEWIDADQDLG